MRCKVDLPAFELDGTYYLFLPYTLISFQQINKVSSLNQSTCLQQEELQRCHEDN